MESILFNRTIKFHVTRLSLSFTWRSILQPSFTFGYLEVRTYIVVPRLGLCLTFNAKGGRCSPALSSSSVNDNYIIVSRSHFLIRKNTKNTGIQLITLPWVHYNPAKPAQKDPDPGIFPWRLLSSKLLWYEYSIGHKYEWKCWHQEIHKSTYKHTITSTLAAYIIWLIIRIDISWPQKSQNIWRIMYWSAHPF